MKSSRTIITVFAMFIFVFTTGIGVAQNAQPSPASNSGVIEVIQFHSEHRCMTCNKIEALTRKTLRDHFPNIPFSLVNVDDKKNEPLARQFEATGTALYLYNSKTAKKTDLTSFAFLNASNDDKFIKKLKKEIELFLK